MKHTTFCNPINISYQYQHTYHSRESADPAVVLFKGEYFLFASHGSGYWCSKDLAQWEYIPVDTELIPDFKKFAPGPCVIGDRIYITHSEDGNVLYTDDPHDGNSWVNMGKPYGWWDPALFYEDGYLYVIEGLSDCKPIRIAKLDPQTLEVLEGPVDVCCSDKANRGFERSGDDHEDDVRRPYFEGGWLNKHNGKYYLTYAVPGTEFSVYADGCFVADEIMGPYNYCENSPVVFKSTGFMRGCGHGCLFEDAEGRWWKVDTTVISKNHLFERRLAIFPAKFGKNGHLYTNTLRGDYPMPIPSHNPTPFDTPTKDWHLLSYGKDVTASSCLNDKHLPHLAADENSTTWWSAATGDSGEWLLMDLGKEYDVCSIQLNFADQDADDVWGRNNDFCYRYILSASADGESFFTVADRVSLPNDLSHDYFELDDVTKIRYVKVTNMGPIPANGKFAISGLRVFGYGGGSAPMPVSGISATRWDDTRDITVSWTGNDDAQGYFVRIGIDPDELYTHYQVVGKCSVHVGCLNKGVRYYVAVDSYNESGITVGTTTVVVE